ncbi:MAG: DinB family protein [Chloroflexi bacterium]|nr:DinB family protein [Chloroflexota bacterium]
MDSIQMLRQQIAGMHQFLEVAIGDCAADVVAKRLPGARINSIGAIYAHTIFGEDGLLNGLIRGATPVYYAEGWAQKIGLDMPQGGLEPDWNPSMDLGLFRQYAAAVYRSVDTFLAGASEADLAREVNPGFMPPMPVGAFIANVLVWHAATHQGEISALKGVQGLDGLVNPH